MGVCVCGSFFLWDSLLGHQSKANQMKTSSRELKGWPLFWQTPFCAFLGAGAQMKRMHANPKGPPNDIFSSHPKETSLFLAFYFIFFVLSCLGLFIFTGGLQKSVGFLQAHTKSGDATHVSSDSELPRARQAALEKVRPSVSPADLKAHEEKNPLGSLGSRVFLFFF